MQCIHKETLLLCHFWQNTAPILSFVIEQKSFTKDGKF